MSKEKTVSILGEVMKWLGWVIVSIQELVNIL